MKSRRAWGKVSRCDGSGRHGLLRASSAWAVGWRWLEMLKMRRCNQVQSRVRGRRERRVLVGFVEQVSVVTKARSVWGRRMFLMSE